MDYALRALCYLAAQPPERVVSRNEIQSHQAVPQHFLSKILRSLVAAGLLQSVPGAHGGFRLGRPAYDISIREVYECVEGHLALVRCVDGDAASCNFATVCTQRGIWVGAQQLLIDYLSNITIGRIVDEQGLMPRLEQKRSAEAAQS